MEKSAQSNVPVYAKLPFDGQEVRFERLVTGENDLGEIRLSAWKKDQPLSGPLVLTEEGFIELIHQAIRVGVLSHDFMRKLRERIEI
jgi:hypothetical protein